MKEEIVRVYVYYTKCSFCNKKIPIYYTLPDFGDPPVIKKCKFCETLYWYTPEDEYYRKPLIKQLEMKTCIKCNAELIKSLVPTHTNINCCNSIFSLDDNFAYSINLENGNMEKISVYLIYSE